MRGQARTFHIFHFSMGDSPQFSHEIFANLSSFKWPFPVLCPCLSPPPSRQMTTHTAPSNPARGRCISSPFCPKPVHKINENYDELLLTVWFLWDGCAYLLLLTNSPSAPPPPQDYEVYRDEVKKTNRWMFLNKEGSVGRCRLTLSNPR